MIFDFITYEKGIFVSHERQGARDRLHPCRSMGAGGAYTATRKALVRQRPSRSVSQRRITTGGWRTLLSRHFIRRRI